MKGYPAGLPHTPFSQFLPPPHNISPQQGMPPWASELLEDMKILKTVLPSITNIEQTLNTINLKMSEMETKISNIDTRVSDVEKPCSFINKEYEEQSKYIEKAKNDVSKVDKSCGT
jgi:chromosome segregation ATPase